ncbi:MAG TPA: BON domain-containing protein [Gemmatimonadaceae bacterium]|nr:BON domain-containing protein [Gemmatimonadaceae bacterium]
MTRVVRRSSSNPALWLAAGAAAGIALAVLLANRRGGTRNITRRVRGLLSSASRFMRSMDDVYHDAYDDEPADAPPARASASRPDVPSVDERVLQAFQNDPVLSERAIEIDEPEPGTIELTGRVPSARDAAHAVTIARGTPGVTSVENRLRVRERSRR